MIDAVQLRALRRTLRDWQGMRRPPALQHGDLRAKNLMMASGGARGVALLDWEDCLSSPPPYWDMSIALHDLGIDEKEAFLAGYGMKPRAYARVARFVRLLNVLHYSAVVESEQDVEQLQWLRARLRGVMDLYERGA